MSQTYEELLDGTPITRRAPNPRHELICTRLHECIRASIANFSGTQLLPPRSPVQFSPQTTFRPDVALVTTATGKLWLAGEVVSSDDHQPDTVIKKQIYEELRVPRLWMIDPRYDNIEVYHATPFGLALKTILAGREVLTEKLLPEFQVAVYELFAAETMEKKNGRR